MQPGLLGALMPREDILAPVPLVPRGLLDAMGPSVMARMGEADRQQQARWQAGERAPMPLTEENMWLADDVAGGLLGPIGMAGIFAGVGAKTANKGALEMAERMAKEGADPRAIWRETGWFQGPDAKWRWEIDDSGAILDPANFEYKNLHGINYRDAQVPSVVAHEELFNAYPDVKNADLVKYDFEHPRGVGGEYNAPLDLQSTGKIPESVTIWGGKYATPSGDRSVLLHELQHGVQRREGFSSGGSPESLPESLIPDNPRYAKWLEGQDQVKWANDYYNSPKYEAHRNEMNDYFTNVVEPKLPGFDDPNYEQAWKQATDEIDARFPEMARFDLVAKEYGINEPSRKISRRDAYRRLAGEAEARAVQARRDMTPEQRRETFPLDSYDVPADELIIRGPLAGGGSQMSVEPDLPEQIAGLLAQGRASEVTDDMLGLLDANQNARLMELYEQGATGMPMPMDEASRMGRAESMGFDVGTPLYHSTDQSFGQFRNRPTAQNTNEGYESISRLGNQFSDSADYANNFAGQFDKSPQLVPAYIRQENPRQLLFNEVEELVADLGSAGKARKLLKSEDYDGIQIVGTDDMGVYSDHFIPFDPQQIRSRFARFDPRLARNANLLASLGGAGLLGALAMPDDAP